MKEIFLWILMALGLVACSNPVENLKKLGTAPFTHEAWIRASQLERGEMVYSFLNHRDITVLSAADVYQLLGESTAYYEYDEVPAYLVGPNHVESEYGKGYLLAFPVDSHTGLVKKFVIHPQP
ncbi:hypothetical protein [Limnobacter sp.]|uniref:hypothetical protein n=1 Tax=Limnobacter sp. TaxID=2003368 RepID=UPI003516BA66